MSDYLTRLQAQRDALNARLSDGALVSGQIPQVCPRCHAAAVFREEESCCPDCERTEPAVSLVSVIAELDRAIAWAKQTAGWREPV